MDIFILLTCKKNMDFQIRFMNLKTVESAKKYITDTLWTKSNVQKKGL